MGSPHAIMAEQGEQGRGKAAEPPPLWGGSPRAHRGARERGEAPQLRR